MVWKLNHGKVGQCLGLAADASARDVRGVIWWDWKGPRILPWKWTNVGQRIHTPKTNVDTKNPHSWLKGNLLWYHVISFSYFVESSQSTYQNWPFAGLSWWISCGYMNTHTHTGYITLSRSIKTLQNRWYIYPTTWHDRGPASNPTAHREFGLIISHKLDLSWPFNLAIPRVVGSKLPIIEINSSTQFHRVNS